MLAMSRHPRSTPPGGKTKEEIVEEYRVASIEEAAIAVIARKGVAELTIQDVADEARIAKGTVYLYFRDREELIAKTAKRAFDTLIDDLKETFAASGTLEERLTRIVLHPLEFVEDHAALLRAALELRDHGAPARSSASRLETTYLGMLEKMFADAQRRGEMRKIDCLEAAAVARDVIRGMIARRLEHPSPPPREKEAKCIVSLLLRGVEAR